MRYKDLVKLALITFGCLVIAAFIWMIVFSGTNLYISISERLLSLLAIAAFAFGGPILGFIYLSKSSTCKECGKKWALEKTGYDDGDIVELHEKNSDGESKRVQKWDRSHHFQCKNCGYKSTVVTKEKKIF